MKIVCISGKAQHGKDTTAKLLEEILEAQGNRVLIAHYGDLVKYVCKTFFGWDGKKDEKGRTLLQRVGTDKIRAVSPDYWVDFIVSILDIFCDEWDYVLIPDTRFPNEYEIYEIYGMDAILLRVVRPNFVSPLTEEQQKHASETALDDYQYDATIVNSGSLEDLKEAVNNFVNNALKGELHQIYGDNNDEPIDRCKSCPLCQSDKIRHKQEPVHNDPLALDELRQMRGEPVWCKELECYGIVKMEKVGSWANELFLVGTWHNGDAAVNFEYDIKSRGLTLYRHKPEEGAV